MASKYVFLILATIVFAALAQENPSEQDNFVAHENLQQPGTYPESNYDGYLVVADYNEKPQTFLASLLPKAKLATQLSLRVVTTVALYTVTAFSFLAVFGIMASIVCTFTPVCYNFQLWIAGLRNVESMRSLVNTDYIDAAANFVQEAVLKYKRLQRAIHTGY